MAKKESCRCYSGIGGQAVLEGVMMMNGEKYAVAVRKADGDIAIDIENHVKSPFVEKVNHIPFIRGVFNFVDSLKVGMQALNYSASFYDEEPGQEKSNPQAEKLTGFLITAVAILLVLGLFVALPTYIGYVLRGVVHNNSLVALIEGAVRILVFVIYLLAISLMKDIRRLYAYHGAEHKCINCLETGRELTVHDVIMSSRFHRRCGTSFLVFVVLISVILFFFINVENVFARMGIRILLIPVIAGISYEVLRLAGRHDNFLVRLISAPGMFIQRLTTREPDREMIEVAIASIEAVFDWRTFLEENFEYVDPDYSYEDSYEEDSFDEDSYDGESDFAESRPQYGAPGETDDGEWEEDTTSVLSGEAFSEDDWEDDTP